MVESDFEKRMGLNVSRSENCHGNADHRQRNKSTSWEKFEKHTTPVPLSKDEGLSNNASQA